ncbi:hypothetical protein IE81DRAFT_317283 [Ceraceosorus guamensis]|uniref:Dolichyl-diphosphooligosaccharide--protein glycosyltransferase subunit 4 n=1 Tax=Ceraceosorus guamensis TaxID=1522189 RepID=A0A316VQS4_9BASI|nr:hypothetical protein IE81DRAFT_317283 [Ceraceosorus guamensis]PWN39946.1 hypothetical protein IE81DRAFT_317283 [Ceraceosorus guamensis]
MISDVTLAALANWLGSLTMVLIVFYHVSRCARSSARPPEFPAQKRICGAHVRRHGLKKGTWASGDSLSVVSSL